MRKTLLIFILLFIVGGMGGCATINTSNQTARIGVKATTMVLIDKGYVTKEKLTEIVDAGIKFLNENDEGNIEELIRSHIEWDKLSAPAKLAVDEFILSINDNVSMLIQEDTLEEQRKQTLIVLEWVQDTLKLY